MGFIGVILFKFGFFSWAFAADNHFRVALGASYDVRGDNNPQYAMFSEGTSMSDSTKTAKNGIFGVGSVGYLGKDFGIRGNLGRSAPMNISGDAEYRGAGKMATISGSFEDTFYGADVFFVAERFKIRFMFGAGLEQHTVIVKSHTEAYLFFRSADLDLKGTANVLKYFIAGDYLITQHFGIGLEAGVKSGVVEEFHLQKDADFGRAGCLGRNGDVLYKVNGPGNKLTGSKVTMDLSNTYTMASVIYVF